MKFEAKDIEFKREEGFHLGPLSFAIAPGDCLGILGENGSGKSTLLSLLLQDQTLTKGQVTLNGQNLKDLTPKERAKEIALVPQAAEFGLDFSVLETVLLGRTPHIQGLWESKEDVAEAEKHLEKLNLTNLRHQKLSQVSGGERQRTLIARALAQNPQILLLDEPTAHLDVRYHHDLAHIIQQLKQENISLIITSHDINWLSQLADSLLLLQNGQPVAQGQTDKTLNAENLQKAFGVPFAQTTTDNGRSLYFSC